MGGNAPFIVFEDADLEKAAAGLIVSKYRNAGQTCVCANRVLCTKPVLKSSFLTIFKQKVAALKIGDGLVADTDIGPMINQKAIEKVEALLSDALEKGATLCFRAVTS